MFRDTEGSAATEFAILFPVLFFIIIGLIDLGWEAVQAQATYAAAQSAADHVAASGFTVAGVAGAVTDSSTLGGISANPPPTNTTTGCASTTGIGTCGTGQTSGTYAVVSAQAAFSPILAWPSATSSIGSTITIRIH